MPDKKELEAELDKKDSEITSLHQKLIARKREAAETVTKVALLEKQLKDKEDIFKKQQHDMDQELAAAKEQIELYKIQHGQFERKERRESLLEASSENNKEVLHCILMLVYNISFLFSAKVTPTL